MREECRRHFVVLGVGLVGVFGDGTCRYFVRKQPLDGGADDDVRQRHPFGGADDHGYEAHVTTPLCGGSGKNMLVRNRSSRYRPPRERHSPAWQTRPLFAESAQKTAIAASASRGKTVMQN